MSEQDRRGAKPQSRRTRLGQELRANLKRRKEQARARGETAEKRQQRRDNKDIAEPRR